MGVCAATRTVYLYCIKVYQESRERFVCHSHMFPIFLASFRRYICLELEKPRLNTIPKYWHAIGISCMFWTSHAACRQKSYCGRSGIVSYPGMKYRLKYIIPLIASLLCLVQKRVTGYTRTWLRREVKNRW